MNLLLSFFKSSENPRYKIVERTKINHFGEITDRIYFVLERKWCIIYFYNVITEDNYCVYRFDKLEQAEEYLAKWLTPTPSTIDTVVKEIL